MTDRRSFVLVSLLIFTMSGMGLLLFVAVRLDIARDLLYVAMLLLGMLAMSTLSIIQKLIEASSGAPIVRILFDVARTRESLREVFDADTIEARNQIRLDDAPWQPTSDAVLAEDPALALAMLRIDLERELRRLAYQYELDIDPRRSSLSTLIERLIRGKALPPQAGIALREILPPMNEAVHGGRVDQSVANSVMTIGIDVLAFLRTVAKKTATHMPDDQHPREANT